MQYKVRATISYKKSVLEPQGKAIEKILSNEFKGVINNIRVGREVEFEVEADNESSALATANKFAEFVLFNPVMETAVVVVI